MFATGKHAARASVHVKQYNLYTSAATFQFSREKLHKRLLFANNEQPSQLSRVHCLYSRPKNTGPPASVTLARHGRQGAALGHARAAYAPAQDAPPASACHPHSPQPRTKRIYSGAAAACSHRRMTAFTACSLFGCARRLGAAGILQTRAT